jgi:hypothetical protein
METIGQEPTMTRKQLGDKLIASGTKTQNAGRNLNATGNTFLSLAFSVIMLLAALVVIVALLH